MTTLETQTGHCTFTNNSAKVQVFFVPTRDQGGSEMALSMAQKQNASLGIRVQQRLGAQPAGIGMRPSIVGEFTTTHYDIPDGTLLKVFGQREVGGVKTIGCQFIRMRATAQYHELAARLTGHPKQSLAKAIIRGRYDVLSPDEARALGARIPQGFDKFYTRNACAAAFEYKVLAAETEQRRVVETKLVETSTGETTVIQVSKSRRKLAVD